MAEAKINFPSAVLNKPYTGTCDAAGDPRPIVNASLNKEHCPHSIFITKTTVFTAQAALRIPSVTTGCNGEIFSCTICQQGACQEVKVMINVTEGELTLPLKELWWVTLRSLPRILPLLTGLKTHA